MGGSLTAPPRQLMKELPTEAALFPLVVEPDNEAFAAPKLYVVAVRKLPKWPSSPRIYARYSAIELLQGPEFAGQKSCDFR